MGARPALAGAVPKRSQKFDLRQPHAFSYRQLGVLEEIAFRAGCRVLALGFEATVPA